MTIFPLFVLEISLVLGISSLVLTTKVFRQLETELWSRSRNYGLQDIGKRAHRVLVAPVGPCRVPLAKVRRLPQFYPISRARAHALINSGSKPEGNGHGPGGVPADGRFPIRIVLTTKTTKNTKNTKIGLDRSGPQPEGSGL